MKLKSLITQPVRPSLGPIRTVPSKQATESGSDAGGENRKKGLRSKTLELL